jgi:fructokinase
MFNKLSFVMIMWFVGMKVSDEEVTFLTGGSSSDDKNNLKMFHPRCKLMLVTEGSEGCRYYTSV